ncbi:solute carrier family 25 member 35-like isoform X2 [Sitodiplosis mosellana]|uniref:solute carrier family 25 member 35-like isoform X2 n=1 Tax=Sitodiplosis mosellana TaxID=263140 RepID=UPI002444807F|nr:solute carrier family 25 member 35-like isoform X2 [Sitodiplosis mosellana]
MSLQDVRYSNYFVAGVAAMGSTIFTNPLEVIKTRLQLQGELKKLDPNARIYRGVLHGLYQIGRYDGIKALQKGLIPAFGFQFCLNSIRLGIFDTVTTFGWTKDKNGHMSFWRGYFWGGLSGSIGSCWGSPFFLVKTHMQSYADVKVAVGFQRNHEGMMAAFKKIYKIRGIRGLYRGVIGNIPRAALGSGAQLATFEPLKDYMARNDLSFSNKTFNSFVCSTIAGSTMAVAITPPDTILTRLYNQPLDEAGKGKYYSGVYDCFVKIVKTEGFSGLYKGFWPSYMRIAPHSTLVLLFYDEAKAMRDNYFPLE